MTGVEFLRYLGILIATFILGLKLKEHGVPRLSGVGPLRMGNHHIFAKFDLSSIRTKVRAIDSRTSSQLL